MRSITLLSCFVLLFVCGSCTDVPSASLVEEDETYVPSDLATRIVFPSPGNAAFLAALSKDGDNKGAVRWIPDDFCAVLDWEGHGHIVPCVNQIATYSRNGNAHVQTSASGIPNPTGKVVRWDYNNPGPDFIGFFGGPPSPCLLLDPEGNFVFTSNWRASVTPSGAANFMCNYSAKWAVANPWE